MHYNRDEEVTGHIAWAAMEPGHCPSPHCYDSPCHKVHLALPVFPVMTQGVQLTVHHFCVFLGRGSNARVL